jgi:hypothetical protein
VLSRLEVSGGGIALTFTIPTGIFAGWKYVSSTLTPSDFRRVILTLVDPNGVPCPERGYGVVILGLTAELPTTTVYPGYAVAARTIRLLESAAAPQIIIANTPCLGDSYVGEVRKPDYPITYSGRSSIEIPGCVETGVVPTGQPGAGSAVPQTVVTPDPRGSGTADTAIIPPLVSVVVQTTGVVTTVSLREIEVVDRLPTPPTYDALEVTTQLTPPVISDGANIRLGVDADAITIGFGLGAGTGFSCSGILPCIPDHPAVGALKSLNGVHGDITLVPGKGVEILESPGDHRIYLVFNAERLTSAS